MFSFFSEKFYMKQETKSNALELDAKKIDSPNASV